MMTPETREYRAFDFDANDEEMRVEGLPVVFDADTVIYKTGDIEFKERIARSAFDGAEMSDVVLNIDHTGKPAAKTRNSTLQLDVRDDGVYMRADLSKNATGRELYEDIRQGFYDKMSFAFTVADDEYDKETRTRTITKIDRLYDVSAVTYPAYSQTMLSARSWAEAEAEAERKAAEAAELQRKQNLEYLKIMAMAEEMED